MNAPELTSRLGIDAKDKSMNITWICVSINVLIGVIILKCGLESKSRSLCQGLITLNGSIISSGIYFWRVASGAPMGTVDLFWVILPFASSVVATNRCVLTRMVAIFFLKSGKKTLIQPR